MNSDPRQGSGPAAGSQPRPPAPLLEITCSREHVAGSSRPGQQDCQTTSRTFSSLTVPLPEFRGTCGHTEPSTDAPARPSTHSPLPLGRRKRTTVTNLFTGRQRLGRPQA